MVRGLIMKKQYSAPNVESLGRPADLVEAGGANQNVDNTFYQGSEKFQSFGIDKVS